MVGKNSRLNNRRKHYKIPDQLSDQSVGQWKVLHVPETQQGRDKSRKTI